MDGSDSTVRKLNTFLRLHSALHPLEFLHIRITMALTHYKPVWIARSDGELEIKSSRYGKELNAPSDIQLNKDSSEDDYYELLPVWHDIAQEWKRILGGMLQREQKGPTDQKWMLVDFPEHYRLYRRIKKGEQPVDELSKSNKLPEAWLYGYPLGRKRRYKSAVEFFPHLLWLAEGRSDDRTDCACRYCAPEWLQEVKPLPGRDGFGPARTIPAVKKTTAPAKQQIVATPQVVIPQRSASQDIKNLKPVAKPTQPSAPRATPAATNPSIPRAPAPQVMAPSLLPASKSFDQDQDAMMGRYIYRSGELTWFNRGSAWGLSVVTKRGLVKDQRGLNKSWYEVQPLSHPFNHPPAKRIDSEGDLRPWLAWSAPGPTHQSLASMNHNYNTVDWKAVLAGRYGVGDVEVDGSIYAAKMIDESFSLVEPLSNNTTTTGERTYNGLYLGGEKMWVGEPVRLRIGQDIVIIHQIIEKLKPNSTNIQSATVHIVGDIYRYTNIPYIQGQEPGENPQLPVRLRQDLLNRNRLTIASKRTISYWKLQQAAVRLSISELKGRWYESMILLPILHGKANFDSDVNRGEISDVGAWINGRGDATGNAGKAGIRYKDRLDAIGRAVPASTTINKGEEAPVVKKDSDTTMVNAPPTALVVTQAPPEPIPQPIKKEQVQGVSDGDIAEFMDLDRLEDGYIQNIIEQGEQP